MARCATPFLVTIVVSVIIAVRSATDGLDYEGPVLRQAAGKALRFSNDSTFRVALFADLHYGENAWTEWGPVQDDNSDRVMSAVLDRENPDFVIYLGDVITANNLPIPNASLYWDRALSPTRSRWIPWATIFGNHDDAAFEWPPEWFSATGIPEVRCPAERFSGSASPRLCSGIYQVKRMKKQLQNLHHQYENHVLVLLIKKALLPKKRNGESWICFQRGHLLRQSLLGTTMG